jgi:hypothetical protein
LEIAFLQKGLVLVDDGVELIEEGAGFGVPIVKYEDQTFFSSTAQTYLLEQNEKTTIFTKVFFMDAISEKQIRGATINSDLYSFIHQTFEKGYLSRQNLRPVFDWIMKIRKMLGVQTHFIKVASKGKITITYHCFPDIIKVFVDFSKLDKKNCREVLILNEQGASMFQRYIDADGTVLCDGQIEAWARVEAKQASLSDIKGQLTFTLENLKTATLLRGREQIKDRFSWAGLTYTMDPKTVLFDYTLRISKSPSNF